jgi:hypothetical protein
VVVIVVHLQGVVAAAVHQAVVHLVAVHQAVVVAEDAAVKKIKKNNGKK